MSHSTKAPSHPAPPPPGVSTEDGEDRAVSQWPDPPAEAAFHGLAGRLVWTIAPQTESDPMALLIQLLVCVSSVIGHLPHFMVEATRHALNLYSVVVGRTAKGRKGTAYDHVHRLIAEIDETWATSCVVGGLSSGEGVIWAVRDPTVDDPGVTDKRLLVTESEFASPLRMLGRDGNVLSTTLRQGWDHGNLRIMTKNSPAIATGAHISLIGHISIGELRKELDSNSAGNGYGNRHLWVCVKRAQLLPEGGQLDEAQLAPLIEALHAAVSFARNVDELQRDDPARARWAEIYADLSEDRPGLVGSLTARAEPQVMRMACLYALLDQSDVVRVDHLEAALAVWTYADASVRFIFGDALGHPLADRLSRALREHAAGLTRTEIRDLLGRHGKQADIDDALALLVREGRARMERRETEGRPAQVWHAIAPQAAPSGPQ